MSDAGLSDFETKETERFANLSVTDRLIAKAASEPRWAIYAAVALVATLAWLWLSGVALSVAEYDAGTALGPASAIFDFLSRRLGLELPADGFIATIISICTPQPIETVGFRSYLVALAMWMAMSFAMMLPSAAPMLRTYADVADVALGQRKAVVSTLVLLAGYLLTWLGFAALASAFQLTIMATGLASDAISPVSNFLGATLLATAGFYQFSSLRNACLEKCRNPFSTLFARWSDRLSDVFRLGVQQGLFCLGCCWALMLVMFVVGTMNLVWMAFLTLFAVLEKSGRGKVTSHASGAILLGWSGILFLLGIFAQMT